MVELRERRKKVAIARNGERCLKGPCGLGMLHYTMCIKVLLHWGFIVMDFDGRYLFVRSVSRALETF